MRGAEGKLVDSMVLDRFIYVLGSVRDFLENLERKIVTSEKEMDACRGIRSLVQDDISK